MSFTSHLKTILFLGTSVAVGVGIGKGYLMWKQHNSHDFTHVGDPPLITGVGEAPNARGFVVSDLSTLPAVLKEAKKANATTIGIEYPPGMTGDALTQATHTIHNEGFSAVLLPPPTFSARNPYGRAFPQVANDAQTAGVDFFCLSWLNELPDNEYWLDQSAGIRGIYKGKLIFAATPAVLVGIECWDAGDLLGAIGPLPYAKRLPQAPDAIKPHDLRVAWDCTLSGLERLAIAHGKKIALLNANVPQAVTHKLLPDATEAAPAPNASLQQQLYEALLLETKGRAATTTLLLFRWGPSGDASAPAAVPGLLQNITTIWDPKSSKPTAGTAEQPAPQNISGNAATQKDDDGV
jgi:hypothetical protein